MPPNAPDSARAPLVGISLCLDERGRWRPGRETVYADRAYATAVAAAGGLAVHLPAQADAVALVERIDALLLPGGDDFLPPGAPTAAASGTRYPAEAFDPAPAALVDFDTRLLDAAIDRGIPVLGICYGMQLIALRHGGRLHFHLPLDRPDAGEHRLSEAAGRHPIRIEPGSRLASILGSPPAPVNSLHHQAVADAGAGLRACAHSPDGVIEALEAEGPRFLVGVQWHPEKLSDAEGRLALFRALVEAC